MTYETAMEYRFVVEQIEEISSQISLLDSQYYKIIETSTDKGLLVFNDHWQKLNRWLRKYTTQKEKFDRWISSIPDSRIQLFARMRFVDGLTWTVIGERMNCKGPTARKALQRYIKREAKKA